jgi:non-ribosomal peptide synthase protein (TIGR01720 family)
VVIDLEGHGREEIFDDVDLSRTVGWFSTMFPVVLAIPGDDAQHEPVWRDLVRSIRRQLRAIPGNGFGYGALRYLGSSQTRQRLATTVPEPQISFNYLGQFDGATRDSEQGLYQAIGSAIGQDREPSEQGSHLLEVVGGVQDGQLGFSWLYRADHHREGTVRSLADDFAEALRRIARDCRAPG